jgi:hypothetical protein
LEKDFPKIPKENGSGGHFGDSEISVIKVGGVP